MPTSEKRKPRKQTGAALEFYVKRGGKKHDDVIHNPILDAGDHAAAERVGRAVMKRLGLKPDRIEALMKPKGE
jgi:hypothetical protein